MGFSKKDKKREESTLKIINSKRYSNCDALFGLVKLEDNVYASVIKLYPLGFIDKMLKNKKVLVKNVKTSLVEVGSEVRYKYKEEIGGVFSCWPSPNQLVYRTDHQRVPPVPPADPEVPAKFVLLDKEVLPNGLPLIHFEEENVVKYLRNKLQNVSVQENRLISINIAGFELAFNVLKTYVFSCLVLFIFLSRKLGSQP